jgi:SAM-dependent methyltransferase
LLGAKPGNTGTGPIGIAYDIGHAWQALALAARSLGSESFAVVSTFTLCTIPGIADAIRGIARVMRPGGQFLFFEHGLSPDVRVRRWQERTELLFQWAFEGCHVTRDISALIKDGGFAIERMETCYLARFPKSESYYFWGVARPKS